MQVLRPGAWKYEQLGAECAAGRYTGEQHALESWAKRILKLDAMIERPSPPPRPDSPKRSSLLPVVLALFAFIAICASLWLLTMGAFGFILAALLATGGIIALHYFIWGWWLAEIIRREEAEEKES